jgi:hypothetical protein
MRTTTCHPYARNSYKSVCGVPQSACVTACLQSLLLLPAVLVVGSSSPRLPAEAHEGPVPCVHSEGVNAGH